MEKTKMEVDFNHSIMDVEVQRVLPGDRIRIKFLAIKGYEGPELTMPRTLAKQLFEKLQEVIAG